MEKCCSLLSTALQYPASIHLLKYLAKKKTANVIKTSWPLLCFDQAFVRGTWTQVHLKRFSKRKREVDFRTTRYKVRSSTKLLFFKLFFPSREYFYLFPFYTCENWIRCSRKVSYKTIETKTKKENLTKYNFYLSGNPHALLFVRSYKRFLFKNDFLTKYILHLNKISQYI